MVVQALQLGERGIRSWHALSMSALFIACSFAFAQPEWEMRVCAEPHNYPMSSRDRPGFNNRIAEILADELDAHVTYEWTRFTAQDIALTLLEGDCDVAIGVAENAAGTLNTVPYLRAPYVFVTLEDRDIQIASLDDEALESLRIGTYQTGIPTLALENRGIVDNVVQFPPVATAGGTDWDVPILDAVLAGEIDVGLLYGPKAAARAAASDVPLRIVPVTPEIDVGADLLQHFRIWTIGVRPHDESFRDRLNLALAARWDDVQEAIAEFGVDQLSVSRPPQQTTAVPYEVGLVAPTDTGGIVELAEIGMAALFGAELAESVISRAEGDSQGEFRVQYASAPTDAAAVRAAARLAATEDVFALIGGFGAFQATEIGSIAHEAGLLFFNIAAIDDVLRGEECLRTTFHVEASATMYLDAAIAWLAEAGIDRVFVVHGEGEAGEQLARRAAQSLQALDAELAGAASVEPSQFVFLEAATAAASAGAGAVILALPPEAQELFLSQMPAVDREVLVTGIPYPRSQTRSFLFRFRDANARVGASPRPALWEASVTEGRAGVLNDEYASRAGAVMEPTGWAAYAAVSVAHEAAIRAASTEAEVLIEYLERPVTDFALGKEVGVSFRPWNHQARQTLYVVELRDDAQWSRSVRERIGLAEVVARLPVAESADVGALDRLGDGPAESRCSF